MDREVALLAEMDKVKAEASKMIDIWLKLWLSQGVVVQAFSSSTWKAEAGQSLGVWNQPGLHRDLKTISHTNNRLLPLSQSLVL
jgi:hypothetical protein